MSDEMIDLGPLGTDDVPDVASRAVRRFRFHVVLFTVVCVVAAVAATSVVVRWATKERIQTHAVGWTPAQTAVLNDLVGVCSTPTFRAGDLQIGLLDAVAMPDGGQALHLIVHGPITEARDVGGGSSAVRTTSFSVLGEPKAWSVAAQPGATWGEAYVEVPPSAGARVAMTVRGPSLSQPESIVVDSSALRGGC